jgi:hypothetical protein
METLAVKSADDYFCDWESHVFGFGYGTGEPHIIPALKVFMAACPAKGNYDFKNLEKATGPTVAWLLINIFGRAELIEYGTSPRFGWLTKQGAALKAYLENKTVDELLSNIDRGVAYTYCYPDGCNCGPNGYEPGRICENPFWVPRRNTI